MVLMTWSIKLWTMVRTEQSLYTGNNSKTLFFILVLVLKEVTVVITTSTTNTTAATRLTIATSSIVTSVIAAATYANCNNSYLHHWFIILIYIFETSCIHVFWGLPRFLTIPKTFKQTTHFAAIKGVARVLTRAGFLYILLLCVGFSVHCSITPFLFRISVYKLSLLFLSFKCHVIEPSYLRLWNLTNNFFATAGIAKQLTIPDNQNICKIFMPLIGFQANKRDRACQTENRN